MSLVADNCPAEHTFVWYPPLHGRVRCRLSRKFSDTLGDDVANELVAWFNAVDLTYRTDLRELNELNHGWPANGPT